MGAWEKYVDQLCKRAGAEMNNREAAKEHAQQLAQQLAIERDAEARRSRLRGK
jgi:hypothetical protein